MTKQHRNHRGYSIAFKREVAEEYLVDGVALRELSRRYDIQRNLLRIWIDKYEAGEFSEDKVEAEAIAEYEARLAALERKVGQLTMENDLLKKMAAAPRRSAGTPSVISGPQASPLPEDAE